MSDIYKWIANKDNVNVIELEYGSQDKDSILENLQTSNIHLNEHAKTLLESSYFKTSTCINKIKIVEVSLEDLEIKSNPTLDKIIQKGLEIGLLLVPLEAAPYYRIKHLEQKEEILGEKNKAPKGSITIISQLHKENDDSFPKGFYIIKKNNQLWLRGYICSMDYVWESTDKFAFMINN